MADIKVENTPVNDETAPLTEDERKELETLRSEKSDSADQAAAAKAAEDAPLPDTHWLTLADGQTVVAKGTATHYDGIPVLHCTEIPADLLEGGNPNAEPAHRF